MKLIITILPDHKTEQVSKALTAGEFRVTQIASTGGFLRKGSSTFLIGVDDDKVSEALDLIRKNSQSAHAGADPTSSSAHENGKTTIFVLNVSQFIQI